VRQSCARWRLPPADLQLSNSRLNPNGRNTSERLDDVGGRWYHLSHEHTEAGTTAQPAMQHTAEFFAVDISTVRRWVAAGKLSAYDSVLALARPIGGGVSRPAASIDNPFGMHRQSVWTERAASLESLPRRAEEERYETRLRPASAANAATRSSLTCRSAMSTWLGSGHQLPIGDERYERGRGPTRWALKPLDLGQRTRESFPNLALSHDVVVADIRIPSWVDGGHYRAAVGHPL
jgi:hypothetical protein